MHKLLAPWRILGRAFLTSAKYSPLFIKENLILILAFFIPCELLHHFFFETQKVLEQVGAPTFSAQLGEVCVGLLMMVFYTMLIPLRIPEMDRGIKPANRQPFWGFTTKHTWPFMLENIRALAIVLLWLVGCALTALTIGYILQVIGIFDIQSAITSVTGDSLTDQTQTNRLISIVLATLTVGPPTFFYIRYYFVSYVVLCEADYHAGKINPLKWSSWVAKGAVIPILVVLMVYFFIDAQRLSLRQAFPLQSQPLQASGVAIVSEIVAIYLNILLFQIYRLKVEALRSSERSNNGINV